MDRVREHIERHTYLDTRHATQRKKERGITLPEILFVLKTGFHEKKKDEFKQEWDAWNYAICGKTRDGRKLRIVVAFQDGRMLIVTAIAL